MEEVNFSVRTPRGDIRSILRDLKGWDPNIEDILVHANIRNVLQLALKPPHQLAELGMSLETARVLQRGSRDYMNNSAYGMET